jgi:quercetin dioxygenase-like cupin family protein
MPDRHPSVVRTRSGQCFAVVGDVYRILVSGKETDGKYAVVETIVPPGGGPPPHRHSREEEGFYIQEGELTVTVDGRRETLTAGTFANLPVGSVHSFKNEGTKTVRMLITVAPAGFEQMFVEVGTPLSPGAMTAPPPSKGDIEKLVQASGRHGVELMLPK